MSTRLDEAGSVGLTGGPVQQAPVTGGVNKLALRLLSSRAFSISQPHGAACQTNKQLKAHRRHCICQCQYTVDIKHFCTYKRLYFLTLPPKHTPMHTELDNKFPSTKTPTQNGILSSDAHRRAPVCTRSHNRQRHKGQPEILLRAQERPHTQSSSYSSAYQ